MKIIALGHKARHGKDSVAKILKSEFDYEIFHFADPLKDECRDLFGWSEDNKNITAIEVANKLPETFALTEGNWIWVAGTKQKVKENTTLLQFWAEVRRNQDRDYWIKRTLHRVVSQNKNAVIADLRYWNEADWMTHLGAGIFKITRLNFVAPDRDPNHISETNLDDYLFDKEFYVDGDYKTRHQEIATEIHKIMESK